MNSPAMSATLILVKKASPSPVPINITLRPCAATCSGHVNVATSQSAAKYATAKPSPIAITERIRRLRSSFKCSSNGIRESSLTGAWMGGSNSGGWSPATIGGGGGGGSGGAGGSDEDGPGGSVAGAGDSGSEAASGSGAAAGSDDGAVGSGGAAAGGISGAGGW